MYQIKTENFEGPIELLLELVKKNEVDVYDMWIGKLTTQYLEHIYEVQQMDLDEALEFLVIAATLVYLKSRALLPQDVIEIEEEEEKLKKTLEEYAKEYEKFREVADRLKEKAVVASDQFMRPISDDLKKDEYVDATLFDLVSAFRDILKTQGEKEAVREILREVITVEQKIADILSLFSGDNKVIKFSQVFKDAFSRIEIVVSFLALLEIIRQRKIRAVQTNLFDEIELVKI